ncbi:MULTISPECIES: 4-amino-4-deoxy-L-arabinose-phosphoundecaprenol flippase subunit ArnF [Pseudomonas syringae group]|uniref:Probable 4-amino-4-deoxy-L-arabinose-phosphoundecaprenol flippase subunit ArnF n=1 Tax=Pseudomonas coronafaciens pv. coronafaciens TaxID=235275 RepID=A0AAE6QHT1_9PSED|nr:MULTISPECIES: 4-amino-4-deoxy-L-arabinose-phosphoundecaprenol flippase subunit ArnF [Pseudomonas syringae group]MCF5714996.1 4-amino-4-deoxy-L-arabinose-phosphoundecaprenol flippase subunit ArnF [Pseudomonas tremae]MCF5745870.1 4-amino-4-deoxy-L-arabinose-phosphoundecaprenol flippase subunit ArnF [Pseudomonas tremae]QGT82113.1 4-amino-4-deoxy-L-arabinose-phosphoundecaprenol flippase subunit ArnF [Pseudomonas coronafaciens pv. coronafaciens]QIQ69907.1 putative 4-amino-4-deoxy-L-arabinose-phos
MTRHGATLCAIASVALVSSAQLGMRWGMSRLPSLLHLPDLQAYTHIQLYAVGVIIASIIAYALSMLFWLLALRGLPLSRAYSLLSISYALVYTLAAVLPFFHEAFTVSKTVGVTLIVAGVLTINLRRIPSPQPQDIPHENKRFR